MSKWTREDIIRHILNRESSGLPLSLGGDTPVEQSLYQAASRIFGSWRNAVMAAGIAPGKARTHDTWPPSRILAAIRTMARRRHPPRPHELKERYGSLMVAARRVFGSWPTAIVAAGVEPIKLRAFPPWTKDRVIEAILTRELRGESLRSQSVRPKSLSSAGIRIFGSWGQALAAAGLNPKRYVPSRLGNDPTHLAGVGRVEELPGRAPTRGNVGRDSGPYPTTESVLQAIQKRMQERRLINAVAVDREDRPLYRAAQRLFGNWRNALAAAGFDPHECRASRWSAPGG